jgi:hypothetical protein
MCFHNFNYAILLASCLATAQYPHASSGAGTAAVSDSVVAEWPAGTAAIGFENLEGVILVKVRLEGARTGPSGRRDSTALLVLDTGAGFLALDRPLASLLGVADGTESSEAAIDFGAFPLQRMELGTLQLDQVSPVLTLDAAMIRQVTDRPVAGLIGQRVFVNRALWIDYRSQVLAIIPVPPPSSAGESGSIDRGAAPSQDVRSVRSSARVKRRIERARSTFGAILSDSAVAVPFVIAGDGKMIVRARVANPEPPRYSTWLTWIVDTGATKSVLFEETLRDLIPAARRWSRLRGLSAPTLVGNASAEVALIPAVDLWTGTQPPPPASATKPPQDGEPPPGAALGVPDVDVVVIQSELADQLSNAVGQRVHGLLGYSFLKHFRVGIDYPNRVMWLDPLPRGWDERPHEYTHVGVQLERHGDAVVVVGIATGSPASRAGIKVGDEVVSVDGVSVSRGDLASLSRRLEGPAGTQVTLSIRRGAAERTYTLARRRLL